MKIVCIGNYPPRQCGIATFTENLVSAITIAAKLHARDISVEVIAMNDRNQQYDYPPVVVKTIDDHDSKQYAEAAEYINAHADVMLLQHEYGIFGGNSGILLLGLLRKLKVPVVSTFHTILEHPTFHQREVLKKIAEYSDQIVIMNGLAINFLEKVYAVPLKKVVKIEHGVPDFNQLKDILPAPPEAWNQRKVMLTFGLIGRSKGIETVLRSLPKIVRKHPEVLYVILGKTHPHVLKQSGEEYRESLQSMTESLGLQKNVMFINKYVSEIELMAMLKAADMYVTPYLNKAQITSGTLSYAVSGGCAVFSTPYWHAEELLANGKGQLFDFHDSEALAMLVNTCLENPEMMQNMQIKAFEHGQSITWPKIGEAYLEVFDIGITLAQQAHSKASYNLPPINFDHLRRLTMPEGILQHASGIIPSLQHGYCLDDNSRALLCVSMAKQQDPSLNIESLMLPYLSYINSMQQADGGFSNFMTFNRNIEVEDFSDDAFGRTLWALGHLIRYNKQDALATTAHDIFHRALMHMDKLLYARGFANCIFGLYHYSRRFPDQERFTGLISQLADMLCHRFEQHKRDHWHWFEDALTYDNGLIPAALYKAYELSRNSKHLEIAEKSRNFLESKCYTNNWLSLVGNHRWLRFDSTYELFAQQPIDAMAMIQMYVCAYEATHEQKHKKMALTCFNWFFGENDLGIAIYDHDTGGCNDGIEPTNINRNQGAESTLAYLISRLLMNNLN